MRVWRSAMALDGSPQRLLIGAVAVLALAAVVLGAAYRLSAPPAYAAQRLVGHPAPSLALPEELDGNPLRLGARAPDVPHVTLVVFFFSLCPRCHSEVLAARQLEGIYAARGLRVRYVNSPAENLSIIGAYAARMGISAPVLLDADGAAAKAFGVQYYPGLVLVDEHGIVRAVWTGETPQHVLSAAVAAALSA